MAASIDNYEPTYQQAMTAYVQRNYEVAATLVDQVVQNLPDDPNTHLLRGHIYYVLQHYDVAKEEYQQVLGLTNDREIIGFAKNGIDNINQYLESFSGQIDPLESQEEINSSEISDPLAYRESELEDLSANQEFDSDNLDLNFFGEHQESMNGVEDTSSKSPFDLPTEDSIGTEKISDSSIAFGDDPFAMNEESQEQESNKNWEENTELELPAFWQESISEDISEESLANSQFSDNGINSPYGDSTIDNNNSSYSNSQTGNNENNFSDLLSEPKSPDQAMGNLEYKKSSFGDETLLIVSEELRNDSPTTNNLENGSQNNLSETESHSWLTPKQVELESAFQPNLPDSKSSFNSNLPQKEKQFKSGEFIGKNSFDDDENFDMEAFESAFGSESLNSYEDSSNILNGENSKSNIEFLDDFEEFDDLGNIPGFDLIEGDSNFGNVAMHSAPSETSDTGRPHVAEAFASNSADREEELFSMTGSHEAVPVFSQTDISKLEPNVSIEQGWLAPLENASIERKQWLIAGSVGIVSALVVATVSFVATTFSPPQQRESVRNTGWAMSLAAGIAGFATAGFMGNLALKQIRRTTDDLQAQFEAVRQGNLNAQATVYSEDELGHLSTGFNEMARVIFTTTSEAQRKADEQEEAKENLQRQVIRLLDDVEGAARGDLTVQAEVTADVLGAVADAFNLTIQNLRDIVQQVKVAAKDVTKGATNSETFARALSSDALRQAEELAVTLNSVQVMTDSIQRVAEAAREAETVARDASTIALKGGEAVENTVAGILEIRETVAETTRKVKRLAESSQEISKIVALISQIASRTNLLALNASIEAARAGEAGRGFAIVADEVRQLADKSAKSLKEIEQIVMQIQSETGSVMTAMEEGTQQVIKGTKLAEDAKRSLENIIQVANRIDILVRSITSDTVEQTETSRAVAHVMQSVELTAQETSQEAQRVSGALQHLVGVSRDLIASVERFRVETMETR
ncbi:MULTISPECIES: methyl-accepting chemotaxis protein [unclassified Nostoc]|uniref:methyl-accepting chemotaxis protein n=1 Tax=unclassified Nostoc TaxID=2593658 RepID=UPI0025AAC4D6|nr:MULTISPECIES: methyl-accepting chemotaxis protein [unclassified Nostoc]MDM9585796.1 methyl-accepting chemotaxis protein [Nostoc sp. GT001]MDZ7944049.1 methyl-accepting chemotaxis protein [Nostoc sp. EfeVER01]MDZ7993943.1 methyl-accepting chemotaxis protein [Nostoc sp. EspVER01]